MRKGEDEFKSESELMFDFSFCGVVSEKLRRLTFSKSSLLPERMVMGMSPEKVLVQDEKSKRENLKKSVYQVNSVHCNDLFVCLNKLVQRALARLCLFKPSQ